MRPRTSVHHPRRNPGGSVPLNVLGGGGRATPRIRPSRASRWRAAVLIALNLLMAAHVAQWALTGRTVSPIEPSEAMDTIRRGYVNAGAIFFAAALLSTVVLGRWVCGWGCHVVALQDLCGWIMRRCGVRPRPFRSRLLVFVPLIAGLYMFVWPLAARWVVPERVGAWPGFSNHLLTDDFWRTFPPVAVAVPFLLICGFATVYFLGAKGYCTYACPYGGFFGVLDRFARGRIRVTDACEGTGHCTAVCTSNVRVGQEVRDFGMVVDPGCMKCLDCVSVCPNDALYFGFGPPAAAAVPRVPDPAAPPRPLSLAEELLVAAAFALAFFALRGIYDVVPFLMALGCAAIFAFVAFRLLELVRRPAVAIQNVTLKQGGRLRAGGAVFAALGVVALLFVVHSAVIQYAMLRGQSCYRAASAPEELVLSGADLGAILTPATRRAVECGLNHLRFADRWGLASTAELKLDLAWLSLLRGERAAAADYLEAAAARAPRSAHAHYFLGRVAALERRHELALAAYRRALALDPGLLAAREQMGVTLALLGRLDEAMDAWREVLASDPDSVLALHNLAGALRERGQAEQAVELYQRAARLAPQDADIQFQLGVTLTRLNRVEEAAGHFERAVTLDPRYRRLVEPAPGP